MKKYSFWAFMLLAPAFVACSDIDLSDVDGHATVQVKDLTMPIKIDDLRLSTMLDTDNDNNLKNINGQYAVVVDGEFESDPIHVDPIEVKAESIEGVEGAMEKKKPSAGSAARVKRNGLAEDIAIAIYSLPIDKKTVAAYAGKVHEAIQKLTEIEAETTFAFDIEIAKAAAIFDKVKQFHLENLVLQFPRGIMGKVYLVTSAGKIEGSYDSKTGLAVFASVATADGNIHVEGQIEGFDKNLVNEALKFIPASNGRASRGETGSTEFSFDEKVGVSAGEIAVYPTDFKDQSLTADQMYESLDGYLGFASAGKLDDLTIKSVSGTFEYDVNDVALEDVSLKEIPDVLRETGTDIQLENPQIYLQIRNGVLDGNGKAVAAAAKLKIKAVDSDNRSNEYTLHNSIVADEADNYVYLSPKAVAEADRYEGYKNAKHIVFSELSGVLSNLAENKDEGGLPNILSINTFDTRVSADDVYELQLGTDYTLTGKYAFFAPLTMSPNSRIKYTETVDGWAEDTEGLIVTKMDVKATASNDAPFDLLLSVTPINTKGERLGKVSSLVLPAEGKNVPVELLIEGDIHDLDGIKIDVTAVAKEVHTLTPNMNIHLSTVKVAVSGRYETEF